VIARGVFRHFGRLVTPFGPELPLSSGYHFVCPKGHETRPKVRAFRDWLFAEMEETKAKWRAIAATAASRSAEGHS